MLPLFEHLQSKCYFICALSREMLKNADYMTFRQTEDALRVLFCSSVFLHPFGDRLLDLLYLQRLCQMGIHACGEALLCILVKGVCGHGDDGQRFRVRSVERANGLRSVNAVHHRHHHIHENRVECVRWIVLHNLHSLFAIRDDGYGRSFVGQQNLCDFGVERIVLDEQ